MKNYLEKEKSAGASTSRGFRFQDLCALRYFFDNVDNESFVSVTLEQIDDFSVILKNKEISVQVKNHQLTEGKLKEALEKVEEQAECQHILIAPSWTNSFYGIIRKKDEYRNACSSGRTDEQLEEIENQLKEGIQKKGFDYKKILCCDFRTIPTEDQKETLLYKIMKWRQKHGYESDEIIVFERLMSKVEEEREKRGHIDKETLREICRTTGSVIERHVEKEKVFFYKETLIARLKQEQMSAKGLEMQIGAMIAYIETDNWDKALHGIDDISQVYGKDYRIYKSWLLIVLKEYDEAKKVCDKLLEEKNIELYEMIYFYKGIIAFETKKYIKAYRYFKDSLRNIKGEHDITYEQAFYLAKTEIILNKNIDEARELLERCICINENSELYYELSKVTPIYEAIDFLDRALILDSTNDKARLLLAEKCRLIGQDKKAYREYQQYFANISHLRNWRVLQGFIYCLLNLRKYDEAEAYILRCLEDFIKSKDNKLKDHQTMVIMNLTWNGGELLICTRENNLYKFVTPLGCITVPVRESKREPLENNGIGVMPDNFQYMCEYIRNEVFGEEFDGENTWKPVVIANYDNDLAYLKMKTSIIKNGELILNKDFEEVVENENIIKPYLELKKGDTLHYQEYIANSEKVKLTIFEYFTQLQLSIRIGDVGINGSFIKGNGYFNFKKRLEETMQCSYILYSINRKELMEIRFSNSCVEIKNC